MLAPWLAGEVIEVGDRKWNPHQAKIKILEGPELELQELSMGRGWRAAERRSQDVTDRLLGRPGGVPSPLASASSPAPATVAGPGLADPLAALVQIGALLGPEAPQLLEAWRAAAAADPSLSPSGALAAAEAILHGPSEDSQRKLPKG